MDKGLFQKIIKFIRKKGNRFEDSFVFVLPGYNLRPNEINGSIGIRATKKVANIIKQRRANAKLFKELFQFNENIRTQKEVGESSWFGFSILLDGKLKNKRTKILNILNNKGIETRPIISGNFLKYPVTKFFNYEVHGQIKNSKEIDKNGFFIGNNHVNMTRELEYFEQTITKFK